MQSEVSRFIGVSELMTCHWEMNRYQPRTRYFPKIIEFLGYVPYVIPHSFGAWLKQSRQSTGLSQEAFSNWLGFDETTIASWERDEHSPTPASVKTLERFLSSIPTALLELKELPVNFKSAPIDAKIKQI